MWLVSETSDVETSCVFFPAFMIGIMVDLIHAEGTVEVRLELLRE